MRIDCRLALVPGWGQIQACNTAVGLLMIAGTVASSIPNPHWAFRNWDFPRVQIAITATVCAVVHAALFAQPAWPDVAFLALLGATATFQWLKIFPYTPLSKVEVEDVVDRQAPRLKLLISNVLMENPHKDRLLALVDQTDPDVVLAVETDAAWVQALEPLTERYPHYVRHPQENYYGMVLFSRLPLREVKIEFLVQDDIPSVHAELELPDGTSVWLHGLHPRPPEPIRNQDSRPRDAELVTVGHRVREAGDRPTIVAGDLNDVAWSRTTAQFRELSRLLDPRVGRGFFSSFPTHVPPMRCPVDHVFHSSHFRLVSLTRLPEIGSDHFPMLAELSYEPAD